VFAVLLGVAFATVRLVGKGIGAALQPWIGPTPDWWDPGMWVLVPVTVGVLLFRLGYAAARSWQSRHDDQDRGRQ
jgi:hypothetical protein